MVNGGANNLIVTLHANRHAWPKLVNANALCCP
jgi:hypothetical protein